jgi:hypothetical protein
MELQDLAPTIARNAQDREAEPSAIDESLADTA